MVRAVSIALVTLVFSSIISKGTFVAVRQFNPLIRFAMILTRGLQFSLSRI